MNNNCPICNNNNVSLYSKSNYDIKNVNDYSFSSRKNPEYMHHTLMKCNDCDILYSVDIECKDDLFKLLNKSGVLFIVCHSYNSIVNRILGMKSPIYDIEHLQIFSKKGIKKLFELSGFKNIIIFTIFNSYPISYWTKLFPFPKKIKNFLIKILDKMRIGNIKIPINVGNIGCIGYKNEIDRTIKKN